MLHFFFGSVYFCRCPGASSIQCVHLLDFVSELGVSSSGFITAGSVALNSSMPDCKYCSITMCFSDLDKYFMVDRLYELSFMYSVVLQVLQVLSRHLTRLRLFATNCERHFRERF